MADANNDLGDDLTNDLPNGEKLYQGCISCHGDKAQGNDAMHAPALAGQYQWYLARQLSHFKTGKRGSQNGDSNGALMVAMANTLAGEKAINDVSAYIASLPKTTVVSNNPQADLRNGDNKYNAVCGACHGPDANGNQSLNAPNLNLLSSQYLTTQMQNFKANLRGYHGEDKFGRQMKMMANTVTKPQDLVDIVGFINSKASK